MSLRTTVLSVRECNEIRLVYDHKFHMVDVKLISYNKDMPGEVFNEVFTIQVWNESDYANPDKPREFPKVSIVQHLVAEQTAPATILPAPSMVSYEDKHSDADETEDAPTPEDAS